MLKIWKQVKLQILLRWEEYRMTKIERLWGQQFYQEVDLDPMLVLPRCDELRDRRYLHTNNYLIQMEAANWMGADAKMARVACLSVLMARKMQIPIYVSRCAPNETELLPDDDPYINGNRCDVSFGTVLPEPQHIRWLKQFIERIAASNDTKIIIEYRTHGVTIVSLEVHEMHREIKLGSKHATPHAILKQIRLFQPERVT
jgi:hypothetical protein